MVLEVGLGSRIDPTNVIDRALVSVITSIGLRPHRCAGDTLGRSPPGAASSAQEDGWWPTRIRTGSYGGDPQKAKELSCTLPLPDPQAVTLRKMDLFGGEWTTKAWPSGCH